MELRDRLNAHIRAVLGMRRWSQHDLARAIGITPRTVNNKLNGDAEWKLSELEGIARVLFDGDWQRMLATSMDLRARTDFDEPAAPEQRAASAGKTR